MKNIKKLIATLLVLTMVITLTAPVYSTAYAADNTTFANALAIKEGVPVSVTIGTAGLTRYYSFTPIVSGSYTFESSNCVGDPYGYLYNANQTLLAYNDDFNLSSSRNFRITYTLTAGQTYVIAAKMYSTYTGSYTLTITSPNLPTPTVPNGWTCIYEENAVYATGDVALYVNSMRGLEAANPSYSLYCDSKSNYNFQVGDVVTLDLDVQFAGDSSRFIDASSHCSIKLFTESGILVAQYTSNIWGNVKQVDNSQATNTITSQTAGKLICKVFMEEPGAFGVYTRFNRLSLKINTGGQVVEG